MPFLLSDTVGFIDNLPTTLVKAFRSTLEETKYADLLLIVSDVSDPEYRENLSVTVRTLEEIGAGDIPRIFVFNKEDLLPDKVSSLISFPGISESDGRITMSAKRKADVDGLMHLICQKINEGRISCEMLIPYTDGGALSRLMDGADVTILGYEADGTHIKAVLERADYQRFLHLMSFRKHKKERSRDKAILPCPGSFFISVRISAPDEEHFVCLGYSAPPNSERKAFLVVGRTERLRRLSAPRNASEISQGASSLSDFRSFRGVLNFYRFAWTSFGVKPPASRASMIWFLWSVPKDSIVTFSSTASLRFVL